MEKSPRSISSKRRSGTTGSVRQELSASVDEFRRPVRDGRQPRSGRPTERLIGPAFHPYFLQGSLPGPRVGEERNRDRKKGEQECTRRRWTRLVSCNRS